MIAGLGNCFSAAAQTRTADSLRTLLSNETRRDTTRAIRLQLLSNETMLADLPQAIALLEQSLALCRALNYPVGEGKALVRLGTLYRRQENYPQARQYTQQAQALFRRRGDLAGLAKTYLQLSFINLAVGDLVASLRAAVTGLPYAEKAGDQLTHGRLQVAVGSVYVQSGNHEEALPVLKKALKAVDAQADKYMVVAALNLLGNTYQLRKNWDEALACFQRSERLNNELGDEQSATIDNTDMSELYAEQKNYAQALKYALKARKAAVLNKDKYNLPPAELALAHAYLLGGRPDSAIALARHAFELGRNSRTLESLRNASEVLSKAHANRGDFADAYKYSGLWAAYKDSIAGERAQVKISGLRYGYEIGRQQDQISLQAQKAARQRQGIYGLLAGVLGLLLLAGLLVRNVVLKQRANRTLNEKNEQIEHQRDRLDQTLTQLKATQSQLVQSEKMVALAALTAGVAHEIQNPLNFVNNFSELSLELLAELEEEQQQPSPNLVLANGLFDDLKQNLRKIHQHGGRASAIVKGMLDHGHAENGRRQSVDLNALCEEYLRLAYHGLQSRHRTFTVARTLDLDPNLGQLHVVPQELGRVLLNLFTNAFYAVHKKAETTGDGYAPAIGVRTRHLNGQVEVAVRDNGLGIASAVMDKIFDPFFTTKPPGEGTGLGLWLSYDIIANGYGGTLVAHSEEGAFTEFVLTMPQAQTVSRAAAAATVQQ
ncbi:hypothetical protein BEN48_09710 [Hymenobacter glacialis]|uniref:histidine kinase n=1 Tax=Hymenobacter glacialis TaxID=1908236 RepID=A0A1G1TBV5_9BACT|nr:hypothetical protein BEN48_09710 [Hymenobacter glacialis]